ncbi:MAG: DUF1203 domain-containing protein [Pseudomonadota bacterium]
MTGHYYHSIPTAIARALQAGGADANGQVPERARSDGNGNPCRHCLQPIPEGAGMLILAHRPFPEAQPYAETGPIFLCDRPCPAWDAEGAPPILSESPSFLIKGYTGEHRIRYGTGAIVERPMLDREIARRLARPDIAYVDIRSAANNCFQCRARRLPA